MGKSLVARIKTRKLFETLSRTESLGSINVERNKNRVARMAELIIPYGRIHKQALRSRNQDASVIRHSDNREIRPLSGLRLSVFQRRVGNEVMPPRSRKSWCLHKILISDTSQSGIRYKGSCEKGVSYDIRARYFIYLYFILFALAFPTRRVDPPRSLLLVVRDTLFDK